MTRSSSIARIEEHHHLNDEDDEENFLKRNALHESDTYGTNVRNESRRTVTSYLLPDLNRPERSRCERRNPNFGFL